ncbi:phosphoprotein phosphatase 1 domain protein [Onchocerca flexuosa]|uniref:Serine/threonine-protein phosphatase n=1 Tax=Onchocerca flexuosa TaxID=387005 RepID=A0A238BK65_9BILA|nr:phosphoprotein phosphatase 1 domain protein [Onchocerca flexuosa]
MNSLETICCLLAHKLMFPKMFNILRGNHECPDINQMYGFQDELERKFPTNNEGITLWNAFNELFACLPFAALIKNKILCVHGGIGPELKSLDDIRKIKRPILYPMTSPLACSLLWSDPMLDLKGFIKNSLRGAGYFFGQEHFRNFFTKNNDSSSFASRKAILEGFICESIDSFSANVKPNP